MWYPVPKNCTDIKTRTPEHAFFMTQSYHTLRNICLWLLLLYVFSQSIHSWSCHLELSSSFTHPCKSSSFIHTCLTMCDCITEECHGPRVALIKFQAVIFEVVFLVLWVFHLPVPVPQSECCLCNWYLSFVYFLVTSFLSVSSLVNCVTCMFLAE